MNANRQKRGVAAYRSNLAAGPPGSVGERRVAGLLAFHNSAARYFYASGREGLLPRRLGTTHRVHQSPHLGSVCQTLIALVTIVAFVIAGGDPVLTLFSWLTNVATLCIIALMALASLAVVMFFRKRGDASESKMRTVILPLVAAAALGSILALAIANFSILTGASKTISYALTALLPLAALIGVALSQRLLRSDPRLFGQLGSSKN